ncbi:hypothetical protein ABZ829_36550 [Streptomyces xanthochromogenes]|uniref:hypothetical protein n=1 Tax=Streptomyces xanthochromogenes TaxID=67384 RepID=UPI0034199F71
MGRAHQDNDPDLQESPMDANTTPMLRCIVHPDGNCPTTREAYDAGFCLYDSAVNVEALIAEISSVAQWPTR